MNADQLNSHLSPGNRARSRHNSFPRSIYHKLSLSHSSSACNNSVSDQVGDFGELSLHGEGRSEAGLNIGFGRVTKVKTGEYGKQPLGLAFNKVFRVAIFEFDKFKASSACFRDNF